MMALRALGALLTYPRGELLAALDEIAAVLAASAPLGAGQKQRLAALIAELRASDPLALEERYVGLFERGRATSLHLFEHVHGESRERGQAMVDLKALYERAGLRLAANELPDYLPAVLEYLSCRPPQEAREMLGSCARILRAIGERLAAHGSGYAAVLDCLLAIANEPALDWQQAPAPHDHDTALDDEWADAPAFGPGSEKNSAASPQTAVMHYVSRKQNRNR